MSEGYSDKPFGPHLNPAWKFGAGGSPTARGAASFRTHSFRGLADSAGTPDDGLALQQHVRDVLDALQRECGASGLEELPQLPPRGEFLPPPPCLPPRTELLPYPHEAPRQLRPAGCWPCRRFRPTARCGEVDVQLAGAAPPVFRPAEEATVGGEEDDSRTSAAMKKLLVLMALTAVALSLYNLGEGSRPREVEVPPLLGVNGTLVGLSPPPFGAVRDGAVTSRLAAVPRPTPLCTRADSDSFCWPFNDTALLGVLDLGDPYLFFHVARYARALYGGLWPAGAAAAANALVFGWETRDCVVVLLALFIVHLLSWAYTTHVFIKGHALPREKESPMYLFSRLAWPRRSAHTMISYVWSEASDLALALAHILPHAWLDKFQLQVGDDINELTASACVHARLLVLIVTPSYLARPNCCAELRAAALHRGAEHHTMVLLPPLPPPLPPPAREPEEAAARRQQQRARTRHLLGQLPGFVTFEDAAEMLAHVHARVLNADEDGERARALRWWQTYGAPVRLSLAGADTPNDAPGDAKSRQPVPSPAMRRQAWPSADYWRRLPEVALLSCRLRQPRSVGKMFAGFAFLSDDARELAMDYRPHPFSLAPMTGAAAIAISAGFAAALLVGALRERLAGAKLAFALALVALNALTGALTAQFLRPFFFVTANAMCAPQLQFLCFAACIEGSAAGKEEEEAAAAAVARAPGGAAAVAPEGTAPAGRLRAAPPPPPPALAAPPSRHLTIALVHEPPGAVPEAELAELRALAPRAGSSDKEDASCPLFEPPTLALVLKNVAAFLDTHIGLRCAVRTLDEALGAEGAPPRAAEGMTIYVLFLCSAAAMRRWLEAAAARTAQGAHAWPSLQTVVVVPPYAVVRKRAPALLASIVIFAGDKSLVARTSEHPGIAPAILAAVASKVSNVLLERSA
jgi:hypothetical protein